MSLAEDVEQEVKRIFRETWTIAKATSVPEPSDVALGRNDAKDIDDGTVLYADLAGSTDMVQTKNREFAAEVYRAYLYAAAQIIRDAGGSVTAYDGDRVMAVFVEGSPSSNAAKCALKINYAVSQIINPAIKNVYGEGKYTVKQVVGVDHSSLFVARTGVRGDNDLVWVGRAANFAAKLTSLSPSYPTYITDTVYNRLLDSSKYGGTTQLDMWTPLSWTQMNNMRIYGSGWHWTL